jgi:hypothetical protein
MIKILGSLLLLISFFISLDIFLPTDFYAYRHWEKFDVHIFLPGSFIPNKTVEGYEFTDRYKSRDKQEKKNAKKIYTTWKTDDLGFRNDKSKSTLFESEVIYVGDSNFVGSSFDQDEIVSEMHMSQTKIKAYTVAYNLKYVLTLIENTDSHNIKHLVFQAKPSYFDGIEKKNIPFYINKECEISAILYPDLITKSNYNLLDFYKSKFYYRPFSKFIRSKFGIYNFPENFNHISNDNPKPSNASKYCNEFNIDQDVKIHYDSYDYDNYHLQLGSERDKSIFFKNIMLHLNDYLGKKNIKFTMLLLTDMNTSDEFKKTVSSLNLNSKFVYISNDLMPNGDIWQAGDSHWKIEAARNFVNIVTNK